MDLDIEYENLQNGPGNGDIPGVGTVRYAAFCPLGAQRVLDSAKSILLILNRKSLTSDFDQVNWKVELPAWLVSKFAPERSQAQVEQDQQRYGTLSFEEKNNIGRLGH